MLQFASCAVKHLAYFSDFVVLLYIFSFKTFKPILNNQEPESKVLVSCDIYGILYYSFIFNVMCIKGYHKTK